ncbi:SRPBCC family protein [Geodermatophilus sp. SYSU D00804]
MTTVTLHATGPVSPAEAWERYARPARWPQWAPQITGVEVPGPRLAAGVSGRVRGPVGVTLPFVVESVDEAARQWAWTVSAGPVRLHLLHWVADGPDGGSTTGLRISGPAPVVVGYAPLAQLAIGRLVRLLDQRSAGQPV